MKNVPQTVLLPKFQDITPNQAQVQTITATWPAAWDFWQFNLQTNLELPMIQEIRLMPNEFPLWRVSGADLDAFNQYQGQPAFSAKNVLALYMRRPNVWGGAGSLRDGRLVSGSSKDVGLESSLNCGSYDSAGRGISSLSMEIDIVDTGAGPYFIRPTGLATDPVPGGPGLLRSLFKAKTPVMAGDTQYITKPQLVFGDLLHSLLNMVIMKPVEDIALDNFVVRYNQVPVMQEPDAVNRFNQTSAPNIRVPQAGYYMLDQTRLGYGDESLLTAPTNTDLQIQVELSGSSAIVVYVDSLGFLS